MHSRGGAETHPYLQILRSFLAALLPRDAQAKANATYTGAS